MHAFDRRTDRIVIARLHYNAAAQSKLASDIKISDNFTPWLGQSCGQE